MWKNANSISIKEKIFRQINSLPMQHTYLVFEIIAFTKFLPKSVRVNLRNLHNTVEKH